MRSAVLVPWLQTHHTFLTPAVAQRQQAHESVASAELQGCQTGEHHNQSCSWNQWEEARRLLAVQEVLYPFARWRHAHWPPEALNLHNEPMVASWTRKKKKTIMKLKISCLSFNVGDGGFFFPFYSERLLHFLELWIWASDSPVGVFWFKLCHRLLQLMFM